MLQIGGLRDGGFKQIRGYLKKEAFSFHLLDFLVPRYRFCPAKKADFRPFSGREGRHPLCHCWLHPHVLRQPKKCGRCYAILCIFSQIAGEASTLINHGAAKGSVMKGGVCKRNERAQTQTNADFRLSEKGPKTQVNASKRRQTRTNTKSKNYTPFYASLLRQPKLSAKKTFCWRSVLAMQDRII